MIFDKIIFRLYLLYKSKKEAFKLRYYKHLWKQNIKFDSSFTFDSTSTIDLQSGNATIIVGKSVLFRKFCSIICSDKGILQLDDNVFFNNYCSINCLFSIKIGEDTIFGEGVRLYDHNHLFKDKNALIKDQGFKYGAIEIGRNCWIGSNTIILPNVTIGNNVVIGANNLIYKSIPDNAIVKAKTDQITQTIFMDNE